MKLDDCKLWRTIDKIEMSKDGRWIAYNYRMLYTESPDTLYLFNVKTSKTYKKVGISNFSFLAGGKLLKYNRKENKNSSDSITNNLNNSTSALYLLNLSNLKERKWIASSFIVPIEQSDYAYYSIFGSNGQSDVVFVNLKTGKEQKIEGGGNCTVSGENTIMYTVKSGNSYILYQWFNGTSIRIGKIPYVVNQIGQPDLMTLLSLILVGTSCNDEWKDEQYSQYIGFRSPLNNQGVTEIYVPYSRKDTTGNYMIGEGRSSYDRSSCFNLTAR